MSGASQQTAAALKIAEETPAVEPLRHDTLAAALVAALADLTVVEKGQTATIPMKSGGTFSYGYADLADIVKRTRPVLVRHGVVALTPLGAHGSDLACSVLLLHSSGDRMEFGPFPFPHGRDAQATGSMVTYMRRYALVAALGMAAGDDDDGAAAQPRQAQPPATTSKHPLRVEVEALDDGARLWAHFLGQAGIDEKDADALLAADEDWRKWLTRAIAAHKPKADGPAPDEVTS